MASREYLQVPVASPEHPVGLEPVHHEIKASRDDHLNIPAQRHELAHAHAQRLDSGERQARAELVKDCIVAQGARDLEAAFGPFGQKPVWTATLEQLGRAPAKQLLRPRLVEHLEVRVRGTGDD